MEQELFSAGVNTQKIKKTLLVQKINMVFLGIYAILNFLDWYALIVKANKIQRTNLHFIDYRVRPFMAAIILLLGFVVLMQNIKANKLFSTSFEKADPDLFNQGYLHYYQANFLSSISYCIVILGFFLRYMLR